MAQLISVFLITLGAMTVIMLLFGIVRELLQKGLEFSQITLLLPYILPDALRYAIPATSLFAACLVFGRMSSSNEIIAIKALGISPWRILWPSFATIILLSFAAVWLNDLAVSWGRRGVQRIAMQSIEKVAYSRLRNHGFYSTNHFSINVKSVKEKRLIQPTVTFKSHDKSPTIVVRAEWAELHAKLEEDSLTILMHNGSATGGGLEIVFLDTIERVVSLSGSSRKSQSSDRPSQMALSQIPAAVVTQKKKIESLEQRIAANAAFKMATGNFEELLGKPMRGQKSLLRRESENLFR
ncbi:MAG: LptF/LptG family permease [Planctomycetales bacterium]